MNAIDEQLLEAFSRFDEKEIEGIIYRATKRLDELEDEFGDIKKKTEFKKNTRSARKILTDILNLEQDIPPVLFIADRLSGVLSDGRLMSGLVPTTTGQNIMKFGNKRMQVIARELVNLRKEETDRILRRDALLERYGGKYTIDDDGLKEAIDEIGTELSSVRKTATKSNTQIRRLQKRLRNLERISRKAPDYDSIGEIERLTFADPKFSRKLLNKERQRSYDYIKERNRFLNRQLGGKFSINEQGLEAAREDIKKQLLDARNARKTARSRSKTLRRERIDLKTTEKPKTAKRNTILRRYGNRYSYDDNGVDLLMDDLRREYTDQFESLLKPTKAPRNLKQAVETARVRVRDAESDKFYNDIVKRKALSDARRKELEDLKATQVTARNLKRRKSGDVEANQRLASDLLADVGARRDALRQDLLQENPNAKLGGLSWFKRSVLDQFDQDYLNSLGDDLHTVSTGQFDDFNTLIKSLSNTLDNPKNINLVGNDALVGLRKDIADGWDVTIGRPVSVKMMRVRASLKRVADARKRLSDMKDPYQKRLDEMEKLARKDILEDPVLGKLYGFQEDRVPGWSYAQERLKYVRLNKRSRDWLQGRLSAPNNSVTTIARVGASISASMRVLMTAFDWGVFGIHSFLMIGSDPAAFAKGVRGSVRAISNPTSYHKFVRLKSKSISEMVAGGWALDAASLQEFSAFAAKNQELAGGKGVLGAIGDKFYQSADEVANKKGKKYTFMKTGGNVARSAEQRSRQLVGRFQLFFNANRTYMGVHMYETMKDTWIRSGGKIEELMDFINKATGFYDSASAGIGIQQQAMERAFLFFAPRYTRATLALVTDAFRGGLKGDVTRETIFSQLAILPIYYSSVALMLGQEPKLDPRPRNEGGDGAGFLTVEVGGRNIGFGSMYVALARLAGDLLVNDVEDISRVANIADYRKNPFTKFIMGRNAPTTQVISSLFHGETFIGEPIEGASGFARFAGGNLMPFWAETLLLESGGIGNFGSRMLGASTEFFGARQYPMSLSEQLARVRDEGAREMYGNGERSYPSWDSLNLLQREKIENNPRYKIQELKSRMGEQFESSRFDALNNTYWDIYNNANERRAKKVNDGVGFVDKGIWDTVRFRQELFDANKDVAIERQALESEEFADIHANLRESFNKPDRLMPAEDVAYQQYMTDIVFNDALHLETGDYDFDLRSVLEARFVAEWGDEVFQYVKNVALERSATPRYGVPDMVREFYHGRNVYDFYWRASDAAVLQDSSNPEQLRQRLNDYRVANATDKSIMWANDRELRDAYNRIERIRRLFREKDPGLDIFVHRWYGSDLKHRENQWANKDAALAGYYRYETNIDFPYPRFQEILPKTE